MFEKKNTYAQGEMRPLSALSKGGSKPQPKKAVPVQTPASPDMQSTVSTLSEQNKITDTATVQRTPLREAARQAEEKNAAIPEHPSMHVPPKSGSQSPDLSTKEARDAYFSKYLSRIDAPRKAAVRTVVSHVKETPAEPPVQETQKTMYEEELTLEAPPQMTEAIENAAQAIRQEREARQASSLPKPEREKMESIMDTVRIVLLAGLLVLCGIFLLFGPHTKNVQEPSVQTVLNGSYPSAVASYYNDVLKQSGLAEAADHLEPLRGFGNEL